MSSSELKVKINLFNTGIKKIKINFRQLRADVQINYWLRLIRIKAWSFAYYYSFNCELITGFDFRYIARAIYCELKSSVSYQILKSYKINDLDRNFKSNTSSRLICEKRSVYRQIFQLSKFLNLIYIAFFPPFSIVFDKELTRPLIAVKIISLLFSLFCVVIKLRTPELYKREKTVELSKVLQIYYHNGLIPDLFGLCPFNVILGIHLPM